MKNFIHFFRSRLFFHGIIISLALWLSIPASAEKSFQEKLVAAALERLNHQVIYDPTYFKLSYPLGDVTADRGVCTDVVIRSYRSLGIDLQELVHKDIKANFSKYPKIWGLKHPDPNIDHRRVPNLEKFFERQGAKLKVTDKSEDYQPGDLVTWNIGGIRTIPHIGIVVDRKTKDKQRYMVVHNIGAGPQCEDVLFTYPITGHFRYLPE